MKTAEARNTLIRKNDFAVDYRRYAPVGAFQYRVFGKCGGVCFIVLFYYIKSIFLRTGNRNPTITAFSKNTGACVLMRNINSDLKDVFEIKAS